MGGPGPAAKGIDTTGAAVEPGAAERLRVSGHRAAARAGAEGRGATGGKERGREERRKGRREGGRRRWRSPGGALAAHAAAPHAAAPADLDESAARPGAGTGQTDRQTGQTDGADGVDGADVPAAGPVSPPPLIWLSAAGPCWRYRGRPAPRGGCSNVLAFLFFPSLCFISERLGLGWRGSGRHRAPGQHPYQVRCPQALCASLRLPGFPFRRLHVLSPLTPCWEPAASGCHSGKASQVCRGFRQTHLCVFLP